MTNHTDQENPIIDRLVRESVERQTARLDPSGLIQRVQLAASQCNQDESIVMPPQDSRTRETSRRSRVLLWGGLTAIAMVAAFVSGRSFDGRMANASSVLKSVQSEHTRSVDYCYRIQFDPDPRYWNPQDKLGGPSLSRLWTRGDRFWSDCAIGDIKFRLGREANGSIWITGSRRQGIRFSNQPEDLPPTVFQICQINSMSVPRLMNEVLVDFDLTSQSIRDVEGEKRTLVWAQLKPGRRHSLLSHALLEIDPQTNILVRLVLWTVNEGKPRGTVAFTLQERSQLSDDQYQLSTHLDSDATIEVQTLPTPDYEPKLTETAEDR